MRTTLISLFILFSVESFSQDYFTIDFDSQQSADSQIVIDYNGNANNIWQIGQPSKLVFDSSRSSKNAILTDTLNSYPINDTSSFFLTHYRLSSQQWGGNQVLMLNFWFKMDADSGKDYGMIEVSIDNGKNWINLLTQDSTYEFSWNSSKPTLTGTSNGWEEFNLNLANLTYKVGFSDTLLYRFTFVSDSIQNNKEGWMIDDFRLNDVWEGIEEITNNTVISIYPNPSYGKVQIEFNKDQKDIKEVLIINSAGQKVWHELSPSPSLNLNFNPGSYTLLIKVGEKFYSKKILISN